MWALSLQITFDPVEKDVSCSELPRPPGSLNYQKLLNFISYLWGGGGVPQTSSSYSAKVFTCFHGNHETTRKCVCEIVFTEDHSDWLFEMLQTA